MTTKILTRADKTQAQAMLAQLDAAKDLIVKRMQCGEDCQQDQRQVEDLTKRLQAYIEHFG